MAQPPLSVFEAAVKGDIAYLQANEGVLADAVDALNNTVLDHALNYQNAASIEYLMKQESLFDRLKTHVAFNGDYPLAYVVKNGNIALLKEMLANRNTKILVPRASPHVISVLHLAIEGIEEGKATPEVLDVLMRDLFNTYGKYTLQELHSILSYGEYCYHHQVYHYLLELGTSINPRDPEARKRVLESLGHAQECLNTLLHARLAT
jgi:hypothetical protein